MASGVQRLPRHFTSRRAMGLSAAAAHRNRLWLPLYCRPREQHLASTLEVCKHQHDLSRWPNTDVAFTFAANPFKLMHANAVYLKIISDTETPSAADIKRFRDWVLRLKRLDHRISSVSSEVDTAAVGMKTGRASPQRATYVGRTTSLKQDLSSYFGRLATSRCRHRCSATASRAARLSCRTGAWANPHSTSRWQATMGAEYKAVGRYTRWYDHASAAAVTSAFADDFSRYGFSSLPDRMFDSIERTTRKRTGTHTAPGVSRWPAVAPRRPGNSQQRPQCA